jgi:cellobiose phosphorylase
MYRLLVESLLGLRIEGDRLTIQACLPPDWESYGIDYRYGATQYRMTIRITAATANQPTGTCRFSCDGVSLPEPMLRLVDDRQEHRIDIALSR